MFAIKRPPEADPDRPVQELAETVDLVVVASPWKALQLAPELRQPGRFARQKDLIR
jgi:hypothetical protein